jgi:hypothetical protein
VLSKGVPLQGYQRRCPLDLALRFWEGLVVEKVEGGLPGSVVLESVADDHDAVNS